jgi:hypothetical protein
LYFIPYQEVIAYDISVVNKSNRYLICTVTIAPLKITHIPASGYDIVKADKCILRSVVGCPRLPVRTFWIVVPKGYEVSSMDVICIDEKTLPGKYNIDIVDVPVPICSGKVWNNNYSSVVLSSKIYPVNIVDIVSQQQYGRFKLACIQVFAARYNIINKELAWIRYVKFKINLSYISQYEGLYLRKFYPDINLLKKIVVNPEEIQQYKLAPGVTKLKNKRYLIITTNELISAFQSLLISKLNKGFDGTITTVSWISQNCSGIDLPEKIRNYIRMYVPGYLLLGGDTEIVPYRGVYARVEGGVLKNDVTIWDDNIPCDMYYACLDGDWDYDKDGIYGEVEDKIDMFPEVYVGRAPVNTLQEAEYFVTKVLKYGIQKIDTYPYDMVLFGTRFDNVNDGGKVIQMIIDIVPYKYAVTTYYEPGKHEIMGELIKGAGFVAHAGHANVTCIEIRNIKPKAYIYDNDVSSMNNSDKLFIFNTIGCYAGAFDKDDCIGEKILLNPDGGAAGFIGNSRYGLYDETSPVFYSGEYQIEFFRQVLREGYTHIGEALAMTKISFISRCGTDTPYRWIQYCLNLLGDPEMKLPVPEDILGVYYVIKGNVNGIITPETELPLVVSIKNLRDMYSGTITASISTTDPYVIITTATTVYPGIMPGETVSNTETPFGFIVKNTCPNEYKIKFDLVITENNGVSYTDTFYLSVNIMPKSMDKIICYPNPCYIYKNQVIKIVNIPSNSNAVVYIYDISGKMIRKIKAIQKTASMQAIWDMRNNYGTMVASGVYLYKVICDIGVKHGKIGVIK